MQEIKTGLCGSHRSVGNLILGDWKQLFEKVIFQQRFKKEEGASHMKKEGENTRKRKSLVQNVLLGYEFNL